MASLWSTYDYSKQTIRGKSELTLKTPAQIKEAAKKDTSNIDKVGNVKDGLDSDYILAWSYGTGEDFYLFVSFFKRGEVIIVRLRKALRTLYPKGFRKYDRKAY